MGDPKPGAPPLGSKSVEELWDMIKERDGLILMQSQKIESLEETVRQLQQENAVLKMSSSPDR
jgi:hypothetical protein